MVKFISKFTIVLVLVYLVVGTLFFNLVTKAYYVGSDALFSKFLIGPNDSSLWVNVMVWMIPFQFLRGILIGFTLYLIRTVLISKSLLNRALTLFAMYFLMAGFAAISPAVGNLEGILFFRSFITWKVHLTILSEIFFQSMLIALIFSWWIQPNFNQNT